MWTSADDAVGKLFDEHRENHPDYGQPKSCLFDRYDPSNIYDRLHLAEWAQDFAFHNPREGQPNISVSEPGGIKLWCEEAFRRESEMREALFKPRKTN